MNLYYFDSSALVKLYVPERGSRRIKGWLERMRAEDPDTRAFISRLGLPEAMSAITRRQNQRTLTEQAAVRMRRHVFQDFSGPEIAYEIVEATHVIVNLASLLVVQHRIRGFDAVHLSTALYVSRAIQPTDKLVFVSADKDLTRAAKAERMATADPVKR